ncbi:hypothetical protein CMI40_00360 [Candidatus Pacearchaeota archaeon]|jgi:release factor glutamine methyltransferase|nr:hypothetical protein [Candidatus Pacearchaeota archaeon]|tara:strand:- start:14133 stop:14663 length:531 start_codon:yes stop_codon:yes gene_type:complete
MLEIYNAAEDSFLLSEVLKEEIPKLLTKNLTLLEIGAGSGIQLETARNLGIKNIFSCDINSLAIKHCKKLGFNCIKSDLFENIKGKFDLIIFNPPYLPEDKKEPENSKVSTTGGKIGSEIINRFLEQAKFHLNKNGKIILLISSLTKGVKFNNYKKKLLKKKKIFYEELYIWKLSN